MSYFKKTHAEHRDAMQELTDKFVELFELGVKPWVKPWNPDLCAGPEAPVNGATGDHYHGINVLALSIHPAAFATGDPRFCTYKQAQDHQWQVRKGEKGSSVFLYKPFEVEDEKAEDGKKTVPILRTYTVFHFSQMDGPPPYRPPPVAECPWRSDEATDIIMNNSGVTVRIGGDRAFYSPQLDFVQIPPSVAFTNAAEESCTKLHELCHATGAEKRLNRDISGSFGSAKYAEEELVAEVGSAFIGMALNLPIEIPNHANYIGHWLGKLKSDKRFIFKAAAQAQRAADWILNLHPAYASQVEPERPIHNDTETLTFQKVYAP